MEIHTEIEINASPATVWQILMDFPAFPAWNPFIRTIQGNAQVGSKLKVYLQPTTKQGMTFHPTILASEPNQEFRWLGHLLFPGLFDGEHSFQIEPLGANQVRFIHRETFTGWLVPLFAKSLRTTTQQSFIAMNQALKHQAEQR